MWINSSLPLWGSSMRGQIWLCGLRLQFISCCVYVEVPLLTHSPSSWPFHLLSTHIVSMVTRARSGGHHLSETLEMSQTWLFPFSGFLLMYLLVLNLLLDNKWHRSTIIAVRLPIIVYNDNYHLIRMWFSSPGNMLIVVTVAYLSYVTLTCDIVCDKQEILSYFSLDTCQYFVLVCDSFCEVCVSSVSSWLKFTTCSSVKKKKTHLFI